MAFSKVWKGEPTHISWICWSVWVIFNCRILPRINHHFSPPFRRCFFYQASQKQIQDTLRQTNIAMEIPPSVDVFPIGKGEFPASYVSLPEGMHRIWAGTNASLLGRRWLGCCAASLSVKIMFGDIPMDFSPTFVSPARHPYGSGCTWGYDFYAKPRPRHHRFLWSFTAVKHSFFEHTQPWDSPFKTPHFTQMLVKGQCKRSSICAGWSSQGNCGRDWHLGQNKAKKTHAKDFWNRCHFARHCKQHGWCCQRGK